MTVIVCCDHSPPPPLEPGAAPTWIAFPEGVGALPPGLLNAPPPLPPIVVTVSDVTPAGHVHWTVPGVVNNDGATADDPWGTPPIPHAYGTGTPATTGSDPPAHSAPAPEPPNTAPPPVSEAPAPAPPSSATVTPVTFAGGVQLPVPFRVT